MLDNLINKKNTEGIENVDGQDKDTDNNQQKQDTKNEKDVVDIKYYLWGSVLLAILIGLAMILLISLFGYSKYKDGINAFGSGVLIAGGSILSGSFLGFIFGIPSILQNPEARLRYNDNLVQISDWLTKIIVGVGLTQLYNIPSFIRRLGVEFHYNFYSQVIKELTARNIAIAIMGYYFILGFIMIYFWTKTDYSTVMQFMDEAFSRQLKVVTKAKEEAQKEAQETKEQKQQVEQQLEDVSKQKQDTEDQLETVKKDSETKTQEVQAVFQTFSSNANEIKKQLIESKIDANQENDPQKGKWGGKQELNGRKVSASVWESSVDKEWFNVTIEVRSTDESKPLEGDVIFHLHPSFPTDVRTVTSEKGLATLQLIAYGAFTVGIECDDKQTQLEIDLAELPEAPALFKNR